jgi:hypothetical protein
MTPLHNHHGLHITRYAVSICNGCVAVTGHHGVYLTAVLSGCRECADSVTRNPDT